jgi:membrane associated rhomboid family serine protease
MTTTVPAPDQQAKAPTCYRHSRRETYTRCTRCDRHICADCMREAPVGHQCVQCVKDGNRTVRQPRTVLGGQVSARPVVTYAIIAITVAAYVAEVARPGLVNQFDMVGNGLARGGSFYLPVDRGVVVPGFHTIGVAHGQWYRLITYAFVHSLPTQPPLGITHIIMNMWSLWVLGPMVEQVMGRIRFGVLYLLSALGGSVAIMLLAPTAGADGASGAIFGLAAAYFVICKRLKRDVVYANRLALYSVVWLAATAWFTSWEGHLGGLLAGGALTLAYAYAYAPPRPRTLVQAGAAAGLLLLMIALVVFKVSQINAAALM